MNKTLFLLLFVLLGVAQMPFVLAVSSTPTSCLAPKDLLQVGDCLINTILFGYDVAIVVFLVCLLFIMAVKRVPMTLAAPVFLCFISIFIGANVYSNLAMLSAIFFYLLIMLAVLLGIGIIKMFSR